MRLPCCDVIATVRTSNHCGRRACTSRYALPYCVPSISENSITFRFGADALDVPAEAHAPAVRRQTAATPKRRIRFMLPLRYFAWIRYVAGEKDVQSP